MKGLAGIVEEPGVIVLGIVNVGQVVFGVVGVGGDAGFAALRYLPPFGYQKCE